ncbi:elastin-like isoform X2 [Daphnia pulicaria]|uniref:elastin-like isoform X2 n=1 Tax=Daphnia pulicaria TaxID=35523 RepID=UPI001EEBB309|nr:elastin-like isoform X2 [Daphnia pulicaria]
MFAKQLFFLIGLLSFSWAQFNLLAGNPLLQGVTSYTFSMVTTTKTKPTSCYVTSGGVSQCRRKRGIDEKPQLLQFDDFIISPSTVYEIETTAAPVAIDSRVDSNSLWSSFNEDMEYRTSQNLFRQLVSNGRNNLFNVGNCGQSFVNFSQLMNCLGLSLQDTTTLTATFTETKTISTGFTTFTIAGCTPAGFPYTTCPQGTSSTTTTTTTASTNLLGGLAGTVPNVVNTLLPSPVPGIVNPILPPVTNVVSTLPLPGQGVVPGSGTTGSLLGGLLPGGTVPVVGGLLPGQTSTTGLLGGLLPGVSNLPVVGGLPLVGAPRGSTTGGLPVVGGLPSGGSTGGLPVVGGTTGVLPIVGGLLSGGRPTTGRLPNLGGLLAGTPIGGLPILGGGGVRRDGFQRMPLAYSSLYV